MSRAEGPGYRPDIAGLRAVAILLVVLYHAGVPVRGGYVGVDVFFVISGFLITGQLARELAERGRVNFAAFYGRRVARLLPAAVLAAAATVVATWHWAPRLFAREVSLDGLAAVCYGINFRLAVQGMDYLDAQRAVSPLQHFWSLAVEEQFYAVWPVLLFLASLVWLRRRGAGDGEGRRASLAGGAVALAVVAAVSFALCVWQTSHSQPWAYFGIQARGWELAAGGLVALAVRPMSRLGAPLSAAYAWFGLALVLASALLYTDGTVFPGYRAFVPVAGAVLLIAGGCAAGRYGPVVLLRLPAMQELGRLSYGWYLWHWPVLVLAPYALGHQPSVPVKCVLAAAALVPAAMSLSTVEDRIRFHSAVRTRPRRALALGGALTALAAVLAMASLAAPVTPTGRGTATDTAHLVAAPTDAPSTPVLGKLTALVRESSYVTAMPGNLMPDLATAVRDTPSDGHCIAPFSQTTVDPSISNGCQQLGDPSSTTLVALFGDSHAEQWFDALNWVAVRRHWRLVVFTKGGCPPADVIVYRSDTGQPYNECSQWRHSAIQQLNRLRPAAVVMSSLSYGAGSMRLTGPLDTSWAQAWLSTVEQLRPSGTRPVLIEDTPDLHGQSVPDCVSANPLDIRKCSPPVGQAIHASRRTATASVLAAAGVPDIDPTPWFCTADRCPAVIGNVLTYRDSSHVSATYMKVLGPMLNPLLNV